MLTQSEIAALSEVSQATVSRILNNDPHVNEEARQKVLAVIQQHDYAPNFRAQSLRSQRSHSLGLVVHRAPDALSVDPFYSSLVVSILQTANERGYHLCVDTASTIRSQRTLHEELLKTRRVDGLILVESRDNDERITKLIDGDFPFVLIGRYFEEGFFSSVDNDNFEAGRMVTKKFVADGHKRIGFLGGPRGVNVSEDRITGYRKGLTESGIEVDEKLISYGDFSSDGGQVAMRKLLSNVPDLDAVIAVDDMTAAGAMKLMHRKKIRIPEQIAIVGFNDAPFCAHLDPPLSSVNINIPELARFATDCLINRIEQRNVEHVRHLVECTFIERASSRK